MKRIYEMESHNSDSNIPNKMKLVEKTTNPVKIQPINSSAATKASTQDLLTLVTEIQKADNFIKSNAINKLHVIAENMKFLQKQTEIVLLEAKENSALHHASCNFIKHPGHIYHLYEKKSGDHYFSMLSPKEWGKNGPSQTFKGSYRLEYDQSWTPVSQIESKDAELNMFNKHVFKSQMIAINSSESMNID